VLVTSAVGEIEKMADTVRASVGRWPLKHLDLIHKLEVPIERYRLAEVGRAS